MSTRLTDAQWRIARMLFIPVLVLWFACIAFWLGPNKINFGKFSGLSVNDFVPIAQKYCVSQVREIKIYQQQHGRFPDAKDLSPVFDWNVQSDSCPQRGPGLPLLQQNLYRYLYFGILGEDIEYDFTLGKEGWSVRGHFLTAPLPMPAVQVNVTTHP